MRLKPIENPKNILIKLAYWFTRREYGKVMSPLKVIYARKPQMLGLAWKIAKFEEKQLTISPDLRFLIKVATATQNGCTFCQDIALAFVVREKIGTEKFMALVENNVEKMNIFTEKERTVLNFIEEYNTKKSISDETFESLKKYFSETEIIEIVAVNAFEHYYNAMAIPLGIESDGLQKIAAEK